MRVMHAAETIKGGVATVLDSLATYQQRSDQITALKLLVPQQHLSELSPGLLTQRSRRCERTPAAMHRMWHRGETRVWLCTPTTPPTPGQAHAHEHARRPTTRLPACPKICEWLIDSGREQNADIGH